MAARVMLTGASGFVGMAVLKALRQRGHTVHALLHRQRLEEADEQVRVIRGGLMDRAALEEACEGCDAVAHLVGIIREWPRRGIMFERVHVEGTRNLLDATKKVGVRRFVHMSALGTRAGASSLYHQTKWEAEEAVRQSGLEWTIFRPSLIHGPEGEFMRMESDWARGKSPPFLFMPYFGRGLLGMGGSGRLQPVYVEDVARAFVDAVENPKMAGKVYELAGPDVLSWPELHHVCADAIVGRPRWAMPVPAWWAMLMTRIVPPSLLPFSRDQVRMSQEDNTCGLEAFERDFGWRPRPFEPTLREYARLL